ncbi:MAG: hypothetical protein H7835_00005, partial [Magnetococcus sp. XQGC-1]
GRFTAPSPSHWLKRTPRIPKWARYIQVGCPAGKQAGVGERDALRPCCREGQPINNACGDVEEADAKTVRRLL